ncbi:universal stress protein [Saccharopolyspora sp. ASAGF58]|uniref:universal stress protein n=1 Tax=Saccharopolyspora sp. ASAGF58 TaxID=2719023 RepID=UPI00143FBBDB|nr:universal stress protein [Saccharopolyspora sp. ASAGF58]QIZ38678.1 universal stress protein [Saccharopolyspora sp. ASAGF58]
MESSGRVVVGVDGSESSLTAAGWAAKEADLRHTKQVHVVMVSGDPMWDDDAWDIVGPTADRIASHHPRLEISSDVVPGDPADVLLQLSDGAELVVVGSRGRSALAATLLGSVSAKVATHARCPVVVVRDHRDSGPVVVGLDNSPLSGAALHYAFDAADRYECELVAVQVWQDIDYAVVPHLEYELADLRDEALRGVAEQLAGWAEPYPNVPVRKLAQRGHPVAELAAAAEDARLLVVGHRGRGGFTGLLLGSVAAGVLHHAQCPVAVVRDAEG